MEEAVQVLATVAEVGAVAHEVVAKLARVGTTAAVADRAMVAGIAGNELAQKAAKRVATLRDLKDQAAKGQKMGPPPPREGAREKDVKAKEEKHQMARTQHREDEGMAESSEDMVPDE